MKGDRARSEEEAIGAVHGYFEQELAEAGSRLQAPRRVAQRSRSVPRGLASIGMLAIVVVVAVTAIRVVVPAPGPSASPKAEASGTPTTVPPSPSANGPLPGDLPAPVTLSGSSAWMLLDSGVSLSNDGGRTWTTVALPSGVASSKVSAVATAPDRPLWLAVKSGDGYRLYRKPNVDAAWSSVLLTPSWGFLPAAGGSADMVKVTPGPGSLVTVAETRSGGMTVADTSLFVSNDDGRSFVQHPPRPYSEATGMYWASITFASAERALLINGPDTYPHDFYFTTDGGATWSPSTVTGLPEAPWYQPETPLLVGSDILVPVTTCEAGCQTNTGLATLRLLVSHDGGATLRPEGAPITVPEGSSVGVASLGSTVWIVTGDVVHKTTDGGQTWTLVTATGLPINVSSIALTGPNSATAMIVDSGCAGFKTDCWYRNYLVATTDGGRTWTRL